MRSILEPTSEGPLGPLAALKLPLLLWGTLGLPGHCKLQTGRPPKPSLSLFLSPSLTLSPQDLPRAPQDLSRAQFWSPKPSPTGLGKALQDRPRATQNFTQNCDLLFHLFLLCWLLCLFHRFSKISKKHYNLQYFVEVGYL